MIEQKEIVLDAYPRGFNLITQTIKKQLPALPEKGLLNLFIKHTSAGITINENADPSVPIDLENSINALVKENESFYTHTQEGSDDMPAHIKSSLIGCSLTIPIQNYQLALGVWQGIYLCEFRDYGGHRKILSTIYS
ncbi:MAG: YjbQ family protein [Bacteroidetes bacterium]|jgi:secondary thiamine-phosphate synthase enzyme|nr:YjbQ family protein [Bacteroidota bacterium]MBT5529701.1 YjbQ family protein [Cytophagia bacterium]MBT3932784.1 YjbQ family protein [Bacteroidota bacterium]MBT4967728.1 YjbQ family protein [Bacteroidota bacterium]MBT5990945.1 YjbQ family protein [Bacteroidota bacterium]